MKRMTKVWGMLCLAGLLISLHLGVSFLVPKQGKIILTFGMFSGNQSDVPNDDCYKIIDETIKEFEKEYPNVKVKYTSGILKEDYSEWLSNQALNGALPDVFMVLPEDFHYICFDRNTEKSGNDVKGRRIFEKGCILSGLL